MLRFLGSMVDGSMPKDGGKSGELEGGWGSWSSVDCGVAYNFFGKI
jgi:hypothetical protein